MLIARKKKTIHNNKSYLTWKGAIKVLCNAIFLEIGPPPTPS